VGLAVGPAAFLVLLVVSPPAGLDAAGWRVAAVGAWMALWWVSEALPLGVTALLPLLLFPLVGARGVREAAAPYADPVVFHFSWITRSDLADLLVRCAATRAHMRMRVVVVVAARNPVLPHPAGQNSPTPRGRAASILQEERLMFPSGDPGA
jgi:hypothetical protein